MLKVKTCGGSNGPSSNYDACFFMEKHWPDWKTLDHDIHEERVYGAASNVGGGWLISGGLDGYRR